MSVQLDIMPAADQTAANGQADGKNGHFSKEYSMVKCERSAGEPAIQRAIKMLNLMNAEFQVLQDAIKIWHASKEDHIATFWPKDERWRMNGSMTTYKCDDAEILACTYLGYRPLPVMPFGKYKDRKLYSLPTQYLQWITDNLTLTGPLAIAVDLELRKRNGW